MLSSYLCIPLAGLGLALALQDAPPTLADAVLYGRANVVQTLIAGGADVNERDDSGMTPLMVAAAQGQTAIARMLVAAGADVGASTEDGATRVDAGGLRGPGRDGALLIVGRRQRQRAQRRRDDGADDRGVRRQRRSGARAAREGRRCRPAQTTRDAPALMAAVTGGDAGVVRRCSRPAPIRGVADAGGISAMTYAAASGSTGAIEALTKKRREAGRPRSRCRGRRDAMRRRCACS